MKLYMDSYEDRHYLVTDDGEAVFVDELEEDGRVTGHLEQTIEATRRSRRLSRALAESGFHEGEASGFE